jgi:alkylated DNA repair dioxygenase AlkB
MGLSGDLGTIGCEMTFGQLNFDGLSDGPQTDPGPRGLRYVPDAISPGMERSLLASIDAHEWLTSMSRRVQHYGWKYDYKARRVSPDAYLGPLPTFLQPLVRLIDKEAGFLPDQAIINEYEPGQGIAPHVDCEPCFGPVVAMVGLGSTTQMDFAYRPTGEKWALRFERRALLVLEGDARFKWTHAIAKRRTDPVATGRRGRRVSVTFRRVLTNPPR